MKRPLTYGSHGGELKIHLNGVEIGTYPDDNFTLVSFCQESIQDDALITFDAVTNDQVIFSRILNWEF